MKVTKIARQAKNPDRYSIYLDDKFAFGLSESGLIASGLAVGQIINQEHLESLRSAATVDKAYNRSLRYVSYRMRSEWELRTYLKRKEFDEPIIDEVVGRLIRLGLLDDRQFALAWVSSRKLLKPTSKRKLRQELMQKSVPKHIIDEVTWDDGDDTQALNDLISKKRARYADQTKFMRYLAGQGFGYDDIKRALSEAE